MESVPTPAMIAIGVAAVTVALKIGLDFTRQVMDLVGRRHNAVDEKQEAADPFGYAKELAEINAKLGELLADIRVLKEKADTRDGRDQEVGGRLSKLDDMVRDLQSKVAVLEAA